jgi:hypothetical protein
VIRVLWGGKVSTGCPTVIAEGQWEGGEKRREWRQRKNREREREMYSTLHKLTLYKIDPNIGHSDKNRLFLIESWRRDRLRGKTGRFLMTKGV